MNRAEIDTMWQQAMEEAIEDGEVYIRYHFAKLVAAKTAPSQPEQEPVAWVNHGENRITRVTGWDGYGALFAHPPQRTKVVFPTMLRKMWSGGEVQAWLDENVNKENT